MQASENDKQLAEFTKLKPPKPPKGWLSYTIDSLPGSGQGPAGPEDLTAFFDGLEPTWHIVRHPTLHPLSLAREAIDDTRSRLSNRRSGVSLFRAPSGEGKSTALRHLVTELLESGLTEEVLWRYDPSAHLPADYVEERLEAGHRDLVIASDAAETLIGLADKVINRVHVPPDATVQFILAARDTDWTRARRRAGFRNDPVDGWRRQWQVHVSRHRTGIHLDDARLIVQAWEQCAGALPDRLRGRGLEAAAEELKDASLHQPRQQGSLLGALLDLRFGAEGLRSHLVSLLARLEETSLDGETTLTSVILVLATAEQARLDGVRREILAEYAGIQEGQFRPLVEVPLGREAVTGSSSLLLHIRHPKIARCILDIALSDDSDLPLESGLDRLIEATTRLGSRSGYREGFGVMQDIGRRLLQNWEKDSELLPRVQAVAVGRCRTAVRVNPSQLSDRIALSTVLRWSGQAPAAVEEVWLPILDRLNDRGKWDDWKVMARGAWSELASTLGRADRSVEGTAAAAASLADSTSGLPLTERQIRISLNQLAHNAKSLCPPRGADELRSLVGSVAACMRTVFPPHVTEVGYVTRYCRDLGIPLEPLDDASSLVTAIEAALRRLHTQFPPNSPFDTDLEHLRFTELERSLRRRV